MSDTIFALASARGKAGVAVIRVSGAQAFEIGQVLSGHPPEVGVARLRIFRAADGSVLDTGLMIGFAKGASFTGEAVVEFQIHGSMATVRALMQALEDAGLRLAEPGEFTRRALENGRLDLTQVEGLADLIDAETEAQRVLALRVTEGEAAELVARWRRDLIRVTALVESGIDFAEEDVPEDVSHEARALLDGVRSDIQVQISGFDVAERVRDGFTVAIIGPPNAGKSTLLNRLAGREAAITSDIAGTTRDVLELHADIHGLPVTWIDTAGLRDSDDQIEKIGVERAISRAKSADLRIFLIAPNEKPALKPEPDDLVLVSKADLYDGVSGISAKTGEGIDQLVKDVAALLSDRVSGAAIMSHRRQLAALKSTVEALDRAANQLDMLHEQPELIAEHLRYALHQLALIVGLVDVEHVLDEIFASFCIGK